MNLEESREIGSLLKKKREEMNISLKEVETSTSIRMTYLQAIEEGDFSKLISPIYAQGFIKQYASYLGMDGEAFLRDRQPLFAQPTPHEFAYGIGTLESRGNPGRVKGVPNLLWIAGFATLILGAIVAARLLHLF
jgi:transcriptional regulator with XRE-family HTH domain